MLSKLAHGLDAIGLRPLVAKAASLAYPEIKFRVDGAGRWVNEQANCTIVSQTIHTQYRRDLEGVIEQNWFYQYRPEPGNAIMDIGAGVGEEALIMSPLVGTSGRILSIEAHPNTFECLQETVRLSRLANVAPIHCAVSDTDGTTRISDGGDHLANSILKDGGFEVQKRTIQSIAHEAGMTRVDYLRMNIEGAERFAVHGFGDLDIRNICISCHDFCGLPSKHEVITELGRQGFSITTRAAVSGKPWIADYVYAVKG